MLWMRRATFSLILTSRMMFTNASVAAGRDARYPAHLRRFNRINADLKRDGILAPSNSSIEATDKLYGAIGRPLDSIPTIHVGGTNGKGTTSFKLSEVLKANGYRTGLFVSPHLCSFRERMQVNGELIPESLFVQYLDKLLTLCEEMRLPATEFELAFLMAAKYFEHAGCDAVVLEVGLGGEFDATNVVNTSIGVICSVSLDHTRVLGPTVEAIATTKAGISKHGRPLLVGPGIPEDAVKAVAAKKGALYFSYDSAIAEFPSSPFLRRDIELCENQDTGGRSFSPKLNADALNANLAVLALQLLRRFQPGVFGRLALGRAPVSLREDCTELPVVISTGGGAADDGSGGGDVGGDCDDDHGASAATLAALHMRPPCRWEQFQVTVNTSHTSSAPSQILLSSVAVSSGAFLIHPRTNASPRPCQREQEEQTLKISDNLQEAEAVGVVGEAAAGGAVGVEVEVVLDMGHNPAAVAALARKLSHEYRGRKIRIVYAMSRDKDVRNCLRLLSAVVPHDHIHFVQSKNFRAVPREVMNDLFREVTGSTMPDSCSIVGGTSITEALTDVMTLAARDAQAVHASPTGTSSTQVASYTSTAAQAGQAGQQSVGKESASLPQLGSPVVVICGTGYIMPEARAFLGIQEPRDELDLVRDENDGC